MIIQPLLCLSFEWAYITNCTISVSNQSLHEATSLHTKFESNRSRDDLEKHWDPPCPDKSDLVRRGQMIRGFLGTILLHRSFHLSQLKWIHRNDWNSGSYFPGSFCRSFRWRWESIKKRLNILFERIVQSRRSRNSSDYLTVYFAQLIIMNFVERFGGRTSESVHNSCSFSSFRRVHKIMSFNFIVPCRRSLSLVENNKKK